MKVDYYILNYDLASRLQFACRLVAKAYLSAQTVFVYCADLSACEIIDTLLWSFKKDSFIPHVIIHELQENLDMIPILIGYEMPALQYDILLNLTNDIPIFYNSFNRIIEIVDENNKQQARKNYSQYKNNNCKLQTHTINS